jgi:hypothetical protein
LTDLKGITLNNLKIVSEKMKLFSSSVGDTHWLAHIAVEELIRIKESGRRCPTPAGSFATVNSALTSLEKDFFNSFKYLEHESPLTCLRNTFEN